jgi:hypothetical protein
MWADRQSDANSSPSRTFENGKITPLMEAA